MNKIEYILFQDSAYAHLGFTSLEAGRAADEKALKSARNAILKEQHSDKLADKLGRLPTAQEIQAAKAAPGLANAAFDILKDPEKRREHEALVLGNPLRKQELEVAVKAFRSSTLDGIDKGQVLRAKHGFSTTEIDEEHKRQEQLEAQAARRAAAAAQKSAGTTTGTFRTEAQNPGGHRAAYGNSSLHQAAEQKKNEIGRLLERLLTDPYNKADVAAFQRDVRTGAINGRWLIAFANANMNDVGRAHTYNRELRGVLGLLNWAMTNQPALADSTDFAPNAIGQTGIEAAILHGLNATFHVRHTRETQAIDLFNTALSQNPAIFTPDGLEIYSQSDYASIDRMVEVIRANPEVASGLTESLMYRLNQGVDVKDRYMVPYTNLYEALLQVGVIDHEWLDRFERLNNSKPAKYGDGFKGTEHAKIAQFINEARDRLRPDDDNYGAYERHTHFRK